MTNFEWWPERHAETVRSLNVKQESYADLFLPLDFIKDTVLPSIAATFVGLCCVYFVAYVFIADLVIGPETEKSSDYLFKKRKVCYQMTNLLTNLALSGAGLYYEYQIQNQEVSSQETIKGFEHLVCFSAWQLGYQFWAIPIGLFYVKESPLMLVHHVAVIFCSCMSGFLNNGFRYWTPFFYGIIEVSSVPLAIMNGFKENPHLIERYPTQYSNIRKIFALSFLYVRIAMFVPRQYLYLRDHMLLFTDSSLIWYKVFMSTVWLSSVTLLGLQLFWASLIIKGLLGANGRKKTA